MRPRRHHAAGRPCVRPRWRRGRYLRAAADERAGFSERIDRLDPEDLSDTIVDRGHELGLAVDDAAEYGYPRLAVRSLGEDLSGKGAQLGGRDLRKELGDDPSVPGRLPSCCQGRGPLGEFPSSVGGELTLAVGEGGEASGEPLDDGVGPGAEQPAEFCHDPAFLVGVAKRVDAGEGAFMTGSRHAGRP
ncbi:MAG: hypothetical protein GEU81_13995 [Nitriliruptorales bacterium]|nr:hypothetical protein [Nitriliruptorales bacterium]